MGPKRMLVCEQGDCAPHHAYRSDRKSRAATCSGLHHLLFTSMFTPEMRPLVWQMITKRGHIISEEHHSAESNPRWKLNLSGRMKEWRAIVRRHGYDFARRSLKRMTLLTP